MNSTRLARLILGFWAAWYACVVASNACDALRAAGWLPAGWAFVSGNLAQVEKTTAIYGVHAALAAGLFALAVLWEFAAAVAFYRAARESNLAVGAGGAVERAFLVGVGLWGAFILADEIFVAFPTGIEGTHLRIFTAQLVSLLAIRMLVPREA